jgi:hypothetical protein
MNVILRNYKEQNGAIKYNSLLSIPVDERIPELAKKDLSKIVGVITAGLTIAFESMNLKRAMNAIQILDLAEAIVDTSHEDNLSLEDLMIFLQTLVRGEYGPIYESMDIPKFMEKFELYRDKRHLALINYQADVAAQYKGMGDTNRSNKTDTLSDHFSKMANRVCDMKSGINNYKK